MKAGKQIAAVLEKSKTPYGFVVNKCTEETDMAHIEQELGQKPIGHIGFTQSPTSADMESIYEHIAAYHMKHGDTRLERSKTKFVYNRSI